MKTLIKHVADNIYMDGQRNYWIFQDDNKFYGYNYMDGVRYDHICKPETSFKIYDSSSISPRNQTPKLEAKPVITNTAADFLECGS